MDDDYSANLSSAKRVHMGTLNSALQREWKEAQPALALGDAFECWWAYNGRQVRPFVACTVFEPGRLTVSVIAGQGQGTGRMKAICDAMDRLAFEERLTLRFESVYNDGLHGHLLRRGYRYSTSTPSSTPDLIYDPWRP